MKNIIKYILQKILGLNNYLYLFARFMIIKLPFDRREKAFLRFLELIEDDGSVLDIGANIGVMTYHFSRNLHNAKIHSFEPVKINYQILERIVKKFQLNNVFTYQLALGDVAGETNMIMPEEKKVYFHGLSHVQEKSKEDGLVFKVDIKQLDDLEELNDEKITAIKLDVEDFEYRVLVGAKELLKRNKPLIYTELWESENRVKCFNYLSEMGYKAFIHVKNKFVEFNDQSGYQNFFFIPVEHCDKLKL